MNKKTLGIMAVVVGVVVLLVSLGANLLGVGAPGFGFKQVIGAVAGTVIAIVGVILATQR